MILDTAEAKRIIWENPGITSYGLLAKFIEMGYAYTDVGDNNFDNFIKCVAAYPAVRHNRDKDQFYVRKMIPIQIPIEGEQPRRNCYGCDFCRELKDNTPLRNSDGPDNDVYCALNPQIQLKRAIHFPFHFECPLNMAIRKFLETDQDE